MTTRKMLAAISVVSTMLSVFPGTYAQASPTRATVQEQLDKLTTQIAIVDEEFNVARLDLARVEGKIREVQYTKASADSRVDALRKTASARAAAVYRAGVPDVMAVLLSSKDLGEFNRKMTVIGRVDGWESDVVSSLQIAGARADEIQADLQARRTRARAIRDAIVSKKKILEQSAAKQRQLLSTLTTPRRARVAQASVFPTNLPVSGSARTAVQAAYAQIGKPYKWGAAGPNSFDCSGLMLYAWGQAGVSLPHSSRAQFSATPRVARDALQPGDLVFFGSPIHHVGMYVGGGNMVNSPETGEFVGVRSMNRRDYVGAGRPGI
ncbi:MAG TPA: NlpC/P60 family protein [Actinomycetota bacterium]|nr:NlpC/P60 family protein [Actinomycetota bacterium]